MKIALLKILLDEADNTEEKRAKFIKRREDLQIELDTVKTYLS